MKFDYTQGKEPRYVASAYAWNLNDAYYTHYLKDAEEIFEKLKGNTWEGDVIISVYDLKLDIRKKYFRTIAE